MSCSTKYKVVELQRQSNCHCCINKNLLLCLCSVSTLDLRFYLYLIKQDFGVMKCRKLASEARATSRLVSQKLLGTVVIVCSVFTIRSCCQMRHYNSPK